MKILLKETTDDKIKSEIASEKTHVGQKLEEFRKELTELMALMKIGDNKEN